MIWTDSGNPRTKIKDAFKDSNLSVIHEESLGSSWDSRGIRQVYKLIQVNGTFRNESMDGHYLCVRNGNNSDSQSPNVPFAAADGFLVANASSPFSLEMQAICQDPESKFHIFTGTWPSSYGLVAKKSSVQITEDENHFVHMYPERFRIPVSNEDIKILSSRELIPGKTYLVALQFSFDQFRKNRLLLCKVKPSLEPGPDRID